MLSRSTGTVLLIGNNKPYNFLHRFNLENEKLTVILAEDSPSALQELATNLIDIVVIGLVLPNFSNLEICSDIRRASQDVPIIMMEIPDNKAEGMRCIEAGASHYMTSFSGGEYIARINALLRRKSLSAAKNEILRFGKIVMNHTEHRITHDGEQIHLGITDYKVLALMLETPHQELTWERASRLIWYNKSVKAWALTASIKRIRRAFKVMDPYLITTTPRDGANQVAYRLSLP
jgi:two-component system phosphate regulon response regulator PhoB